MLKYLWVEVTLVIEGKSYMDTWQLQIHFKELVSHSKFRVDWVSRELDGGAYSLRVIIGSVLWPQIKNEMTLEKIGIRRDIQ